MTNTNTTNQTNLTPKETVLLNAIAVGMDEAGSGWLHELAPSTKETAAVLGSLIKKGLAESFDEREPDMPTCYWVTITELGEASI